MGDRAYLSIGEVLSLLKEEFPDITISKIRFLESQGLIDPERTPSGYRKFYEPDVELLKVILREQRENYLPLRVIKDRIDSGAIDPSGEMTKPDGLADVHVGADPQLDGRDDVRHGAPVNQELLLATLIDFSGVTWKAMERFGVELTDSAYVVASMRVMARMGTSVLRRMEEVDAKFVPALHSVGMPLEQRDKPLPVSFGGRGLRGPDDESRRSAGLTCGSRAATIACWPRRQSGPGGRGWRNRRRLPDQRPARSVRAREPRSRARRRESRAGARLAGQYQHGGTCDVRPVVRDGRRRERGAQQEQRDEDESVRRTRERLRIAADYFFFSSVNTSLATALSVSNTPPRSMLWNQEPSSRTRRCSVVGSASPTSPWYGQPKAVLTYPRVHQPRSRARARAHLGGRAARGLAADRIEPLAPESDGSAAAWDDVCRRAAARLVREHGRPRDA